VSHRRRLLAVLAGGVVAALLSPGPARAQEAWDATLLITPFPSPYLSDWETNPNIATFTLINGTDREQAVVLHYEVRNQAGRVVTAGRSDPQVIAPGAPAIYTSFTDIAGSTEHDPGLEDQVTRSGRMPEGDYVACVVAAAPSGLVLARACESFTVVYPDPPMLIGPADGEVIATAAPIFQWTPLQVPIDFTLHYALQIAEVRPGQTPYTALTANIPHYENLDVGTTSLSYPVDGLPLVAGQTYAWRIVARDQNGYAAATNGGSSEIWTFQYDDGTDSVDQPSPASPIALNLSGDPNNPRGSAPPDDVTGLREICSEWDAPASRQNAITLGILPRLVFPGALEVPASLIRQELAGGHRVWAVIGNRSFENPAVLLYGDCDGPFQRTVLRWIGLRRMGETQELGAWLQGTPSDSLPQDAAGTALLKFGVGIFSFYDMTATGDSLEPVAAFLEGNSIDVQPGLNLYGILDGNDQTTWLGKALGGIANVLHTTTRDFEVSGFAGMNNSLSVGGSIGGGEGAGFEGGLDLSLESTFLVLRAAAPKWEKPWDSDKVKSIQLGVLFVIKDSAFVATGGSTGGGASSGREIAWDVVPGLTLTVVTANDVTWEGTIAVDFTNLRIWPPDFKLVVKLTTDHQWRPGPLAGTQWYVGNPEVELDIENLKEFITAGEEWSLGIGGSLGWGNEPAIAKVGVTVGRKDRDATLDEVIARDSLMVLADSTRIERIKETLRLAEEQDDTERMAHFRNALKDQERRLQQNRTSLAAHQNERRFHSGAKPRPKPDTAGPKPPGADPGTRDAWFWRARVALGNMSLLDLLDLLRKATTP